MVVPTLGSLLGMVGCIEIKSKAFEHVYLLGLTTDYTEIFTENTEKKDINNIFSAFFMLIICVLCGKVFNRISAVLIQLFTLFLKHFVSNFIEMVKQIYSYFITYKDFRIS